MPFIYEEKCFVKIHSTICMAPNTSDLNPVDYASWGTLAAEHVSHSDFQHRQSPAWTISKTEYAHAGRILTNRSSTNLLITGRDKLKVVVWLNGEHIEQLFWLSGSFAVVLCYVAYMYSKSMHAFCHCVSSFTMVLWQKVNLANS